MDGTNSELTDSKPIENSTDMFGGLPDANSDSGNYRVLARKYRPQNFNDLYGQDAMVQTLSNAFETGRIAQAWMLTGVRGVGKTTTARILARALNYNLPGKIEKPTINLEEIGSHCQAIMEGRHIDVIEMDAASHTGINDIREITDAARYSPASARYKVYIIDEVHMLSNAAFNGLLKTLEEPPEHVKFIFATTEIRKVPVTVLSRCQRFDLRRIDAEVLVKLMREISNAESVDISDEALSIIARAGEGSARDSLSLLDQAISHGAGHIDAESVRMMLGLSDRTKVIDLFEQVMNGKASEALENLLSQYNAGAEPVIIVSDLAEFVHLVTRMKIAPDSVLNAAITEAERTRGLELSKKLSLGILSRAWQILLKGIPEVQLAPNPLAAADMILVRLCYSADLPSPEETLKSLRSGKIPETTANVKAQTDSQVAASATKTDATEISTTDRDTEKPSESNNATESESNNSAEQGSDRKSPEQIDSASTKNTTDQTTESNSLESSAEEGKPFISAESDSANSDENTQVANQKDANANSSPDSDKAIEKPNSANCSESNNAPESESADKTESESGSDNSVQTDSDSQNNTEPSGAKESSESLAAEIDSADSAKSGSTGSIQETHTANQMDANENSNQDSEKNSESANESESEVEKKNDPELDLDNPVKTDSNAEDKLNESPERESTLESNEKLDSSTILEEEYGIGASEETHTANQVSQNESQSEFSLKSLEDLANLASEKREIRLKVSIETLLRPVSFEPGRIEFQSSDKLPVDFAFSLGQKLKDWTGETWEVVSSQQEGGSTIREKTENEQKTKFDEAEKIPAVSEILKTWPGAKITNVKSWEESENSQLSEIEEEPLESLA